MGMEQMGQAARAASVELARLSTADKNQALNVIADALTQAKAEILAANAIDLAKAEERGIGVAMLDRLRLDDKRLNGIIDDMRHVAKLPDPVGEEFDSRVLENGLRLCKRREPVGVIGVIYEARPNVTVDITSLCLKTGNACILRGGSETLNSNMAIIKAVKTGLLVAKLPENAVQYIENPDHACVTELLHLDRYVDMIIPRGGARLHHLCRQESTIPVIIGGFGVGHIFVDETADLERSVTVIENSKVQRPSACNSVDTILVHEKIADQFLPKLAAKMREKSVRMVCHGDHTQALVSQVAPELVSPGQEEDFDNEWLGLTMNVAIVFGLEAVLTHMRVHNASHSDAILTNDYANACRFVNEVGSACAYINASTRFSDGGQFGLGAEVAISTQKLHARGPMGLAELTTYKWICQGDYLTRK